MKKLWKNNLTIYTACMMVIGLLFLNVQEVAAHEAYYSNGVGVPLRWAHVDNTICYVKISTYNLSEDYTPYYNDVIYAWPNASARVSVTPTTFAESNIDLVTPTEAAWREMFPGDAAFVKGSTERTSTDGVKINSAATASASSGFIDYASCLFTPLGGYTSTTQKKGTMVHELGHALGLGHSNMDYPSDDPSNMRWGTIENYWTPQTHDINDLDSFYY